MYRKQNRILLERIVDSFPEIYLTLISILQSVMIGYLVTLFFQERSMGFFNSGLICRFFATAIGIIIIWNEYRMGSTVLKWIPDIADAIIPFFLIILQILVIKCLKFHEFWWFLWFGWLFFFSAIAYLNMYIKAESYTKIENIGNNPDENILIYSKQINEQVLKAIGFYRNWNPFLCCLLSLYYFFSFSILGLDKAFSMNLFDPLVFSFFALGFNILFLFRGELYWKHILEASKKPHK